VAYFYQTKPLLILRILLADYDWRRRLQMSNHILPNDYSKT